MRCDVDEWERAAHAEGEGENKYVRERESAGGIENERVVVVVGWGGGKECVKGNTGLGGAGCARKGVTVSEGAPRGTGRS